MGQPPHQSRTGSRSRICLAGYLLLAFGVGCVTFPDAAPAQAPARTRAATGCVTGEGASPDRVSRVEPDGEFLLASGSVVILADVRGRDLAEPPPPGRPASAAWLAGAAVGVRPLGPPDRWNRRPVGLDLLDAGAGPTDLAELLVAEGLARVDPGERDGLCRPGLLALERDARARARGLWSVAARNPVPASDPEALRGRAGEFVLVEGRVASVGERAARTYVNFGRDFARDFSASIPRRNWAAMRRAGLTAAALTGKTVRVRGILEVRRGPAIEILSTELVEFVDPRRETP